MRPTVSARWASYRLRLAAGHSALGRPEDALRHAAAAVRHLERCTDRGNDLATAHDIVATCQRELGRLDAAVTARRHSIALLEQTAPCTRPCTLAYVQLGDLLRFQGQFEEAEAVLRRALASAVADDGTHPPIRALVLNALGIVDKDTGRYAAAHAAYSEALALIAATGGQEHPAAASVWHNIAGVAYAQGRAGEAATAACRAVEIRESAFGPDHHLVAQDLAVYGAALLELGRTTEAEELFQRTLSIFRARHPADEYEVAVNLSNLAVCRLRHDDGAGAEALFREGLRIKRAILGGDHPEVARQINNLAVAVAAQRSPRGLASNHFRGPEVAWNSSSTDGLLCPRSPRRRSESAPLPSSPRPPRNAPATPSSPTVTRQLDAPNASATKPPTGNTRRALPSPAERHAQPQS